ncbi:DoxX family membrane protein, partial [Candidatus Parcubacteria bacterium]|nr:DoxX family membrane protein [Candidatus Parcubacteria bacterium]
MALIFLLGRIIFGGFFLSRGIDHFKNIEALTAYAMSKGVPRPRLSVQAGGVLLLVGGLSFVTGHWPGIGVIALVMFLVPVTFKIHAYWKESDPTARSLEQVSFGKNLALLGAVPP